MRVICYTGSTRAHHTHTYTYIHIHTHLQIFGSLVSVQGKLSFIGNNAESYDGGALYITEFGQLKLYSGAQVDFINNTGRCEAGRRQTRGGGREEGDLEGKVGGWEGVHHRTIGAIACMFHVEYSSRVACACSLKVVNMGTAISETNLMDKWAASKRTQVSAILCIKLLPLLENALKLNFKALYETENLDPLQGPTHTLTPSSIHTQNRPQNYGWIYHLLSSLAGYSPKLTATLKNRGLATLGFQKKFHAHQLKPTQAKASFQKVNLPPAKLGMLFHVHLSVTEFWPHIYSLSPAQSSYQTSQIRPNTKMGGACNAERSTL